MATPHEIDQWLQQGITAAKAGEIDTARFLLLDVVEQQQTNEAAWYWLYQVFHNIEDKRICLENLIIINPNNLWAKQELLNLLQPDSGEVVQKVSPSPKKSGPVMLKLVFAFWIGISTILLGSGIIWIIQLFMLDISRQLPTNIVTTNLVIALSFALVGVFGLAVAVGLFRQSILGFYGSILLSLGLLLIGPTVSLIANPPNYVTMLCTGGISGMIMLLTLASQAGATTIAQNDNTSD